MKFRISKIPLLLLVFLMGNPVLSFTQDTNQPSWVLYGKGLRAYEERVFDQALLYFRAAIKKRGIFPEAEIMVARSLGIGGDNTIKQRQLEKAYEQKDLLDNPNDKYVILYELADLASQEVGPDGEKIKQKEKNFLLEILNDDKVFQKAESENLLGAYNKSLLDRSVQPLGLDKILTLYRDKLTFSLEAHKRLARIYFDAGAYNKSLNHSLMIFISFYTELTQRYLDFDPSFKYTGLRDFHEKIFVDLSLYKPFLQFIAQAGILDNLELISSSLDNISQRLNQAPEDFTKFYTYLGFSAAQELQAQLKERSMEIISLRQDLIRRLLSRDMVLEGLM
ncbi:MAG: hypothetical protein A2Z96_04685 [Spirochaetes bacterium GWB1_48_6]|nr:MAG: hypothetical protein A2Z96_04685 [Spirochaetes bacterium GWB1_48_6]